MERERAQDLAPLTDMTRLFSHLNTHFPSAICDDKRHWHRRPLTPVRGRLLTVPQDDDLTRNPNKNTHYHRFTNLHHNTKHKIKDHNNNLPKDKIQHLNSCNDGSTVSLIMLCRLLQAKDALYPNPFFPSSIYYSFFNKH